MKENVSEIAQQQKKEIKKFYFFFLLSRAGVVLGEEIPEESPGVERRMSSVLPQLSSPCDVRLTRGGQRLGGPPVSSRTPAVIMLAHLATPIRCVHCLLTGNIVQLVSMSSKTGIYMRQGVSLWNILQILLASSLRLWEVY